MNRDFVSYTSIICCVFLITLGVTSCNRAIKPERLKLVDGEIDACLLVTPTELETVTGFNVVADNYPLNPVGTSCMYSKTDGNPVLSIFVTTDATLKRNHRYDTAEYLYNSWKAEELKDPHQYTVEDIDGLGSPAYFSNDQGFELAVRVLHNGIYYEFTGYSYSASGINRDKVIQIAEIALQRVP
jgi:hypothetical protein